MDTLEYAMQMEKDGQEYYRQLAEQTDNKGLKNILGMLADEEARHYEVIRQMPTETAGAGESTILVEAKNVFEELKESGEQFDFEASQKEVYRKAQDMEKRSRDFYIEKAGEATDEGQRQTLLGLAEEEKKHYFLLENIIEFVSRPESWLEDAEFYHLEEY